MFFRFSFFRFLFSFFARAFLLYSFTFNKSGSAVCHSSFKRFKRKVEQAGILKEVRKREHYLKPSVKAKLKARAAEARARKREKRILLNAGV